MNLEQGFLILTLWTFGPDRSLLAGERVGTVLCIVGCLVAPLASAHWLLVALTQGHEH